MSEINPYRAPSPQDCRNPNQHEDDTVLVQFEVNEQMLLQAYRWVIDPEQKANVLEIFHLLFLQIILAIGLVHSQAPLAIGLVPLVFGLYRFRVYYRAVVVVPRLAKSKFDETQQNFPHLSLGVWRLEISPSQIAIHWPTGHGAHWKMVDANAVLFHPSLFSSGKLFLIIPSAIVIPIPQNASGNLSWVQISKLISKHAGGMTTHR